MARFNTKAPGNKTENLAGGQAYKQDVKTELASILLTSFIQNQYYRDSGDTIKRIRELLDDARNRAVMSMPLFAAKASLYARREFGMRSVSHVIAGEIAARAKGVDWTKRYFDKIVYRPDDMAEILSYYYALGHKNEPNALKKGFAKALGRFDAYQLAKYRGEGKAVSLVDIVNLTHPEHTEAIAGLIKGTLKSTETWESKLTKAGQEAKDVKDKEARKAQAWESLLKENRLGYFALLRNLRNIIEQAPALTDTAVAQLTNERAIKNSLVLPFRFFSAYKEISKLSGPEARQVMKGLSDALDISVANMPKFEGRSLVVVDHSGSMDSVMSDHSNATLFEIGALFGVGLAKATNADFMYFGDTAKYYAVTGDSIMGQLKWLNQCNEGSYMWWSSSMVTLGKLKYKPTDTNVGHGTNFQAIFDEANQPYDRVFIFSDMQAWVGYHAPVKNFEAYKKRHNANPSVYAFDLSGHGTTQFPADRIYELAGFSEKIFDVVKLLDKDRHALVKEIEAVEI